MLAQSCISPNRCQARSARLVFRLEWRSYPVKEAKDGRVEMIVGDEMLGGFRAPESSELRRVKLYSGAARTAMLERVRARPAVLALMPDGQMVHLVYVVRSAVHHDEVESLAAATKRRESIAQQCAKWGLALQVPCLATCWKQATSRSARESCCN
jgi:hypothetical protein